MLFALANRGEEDCTATGPFPGTLLSGHAPPHRWRCDRPRVRRRTANKAPVALHFPGQTHPEDSRPHSLAVRFRSAATHTPVPARRFTVFRPYCCRSRVLSTRPFFPTGNRVPWDHPRSALPAVVLCSGVSPAFGHYQIHQHIMLVQRDLLDHLGLKGSRNQVRPLCTAPQ